jgi:hypothetical protein
MAPRLIRRRRDGLVEIRRARARDLVSTSDTVVLLALLAGFLFFALVLVISLVFDPPFLAIAAWLVLVFAVDARRPRPALRLVEARVPPPPGSAA